MNKILSRPETLLQEISPKFPGAWAFVERARLMYEHEEVEWPKWCFIPNDVWRAIGARTSADPNTGLSADIAKFSASTMMAIPSLQALGTWRYTKGLYRFDETVYAAVKETPITGKLPSSLLHNLPEWCVYVETPDMLVWGNRLFGFFATIGYDSTDGQSELKLLLDTEERLRNDDGTNSLLLPLAIHLGDWSIEEGIVRMREVSRERSGITYKVREHETEQEAPTDSPVFKQLVKELADILSPLVSLTLYLCSPEKDVSHLGAAQELKAPEIVVNTKRGPRIFQQDRITRWDVGLRVGAALRKAMEQIEEQERTEQLHGKPRGPMAPHIRRAHWHTYWKGARGSAERVAYALWLSPILVNIDDLDSMLTTVHPVVP